ncbi:VOC family protein [Amycolatopsis aidingensis]|uniref:VOC family protein n=1 Tax=Amycolatopsis aidingensis TaxID=2842453 RepID=UPI001C0E7918|nr:VOC family protein [Amycolatopsis aidingensis]
MSTGPVTLALPIADRGTSFEFYRAALGLTPFGEPAEDGLPEPLQFAVNDGLRLMLVPAEGFGWVVGGREVAGRGTSECLLGLSAGTEAEVDAIIQRATGAGAEIVIQPGQQPWGYAGTFADPDGHAWMVTKADQAAGDSTSAP